MPLSDRQIAKLAMKKNEAGAAEKDGKAEKDRLTDRIVEELNRRGTKTLETGYGAYAVKVTGVFPEETEYDWDILASELSPRLLRRIQVKAVDKQALAELVQEGVIDTAVVARAATVVPKRSYVIVSVKERG
jgi:hypothetical protein